MGRNGAGKSTLLRHAAGLLAPTRGRIERAGRVALLLQNPGDYFVHEHVAEEASARCAARRSGCRTWPSATPATCPGASVSASPWRSSRATGDPPAVLALDEPTRGMDRESKAELALELRRRAEQGQAVIVATHDPEFAASCAERAILLADGRVIADGPASELLAGGWYFATETARILGGAGGALLPEQGAELLAARTGAASCLRRMRRVRRMRSAPSQRTPARARSTPARPSRGSRDELAARLLADRRADPRSPAGSRMSAAGPRRAWSRSWPRSPPSPRSAATRSSRCRTSSRSPRSRSSSATRSGRCPASPSARSACSPPTSCSARAPTPPGRWPPGGSSASPAPRSERLTHRRIGRVPLALACAVAALVAKEIMNLYTYTLAATHTPAAFLAIAGTALPFDLTDMIATLLFALAFGPELARLLARTRERMTVQMGAPTRRRTPRESRSVAAARDRRRWSARVVCVARCRVALRHVVARRCRARACASSLAPSSRSWPPPRTPTAASAARAGRAPASCTPPGRRWASPPPGATPRACAARGTRCSTRCAPRRRRCRASATPSARSSPRARAAPPRTRSRAATSSPKCCARASATTRSTTRSTSRRSRSSRCARSAIRPASRAIHQAAGWIERQQNSDGGFSFGDRGSPSDVDDTGAALQALADAGARNRARARGGARAI